VSHNKRDRELGFKVVDASKSCQIHIFTLMDEIDKCTKSYK